jgi:DNA repair exonuclease SbcCD nuclease subunit
MTEFRFLHAADIHLDSPMRGLEADPDAPAQLLREATRSAFRNLIDLAIGEQVAFMLIAGDLYDGDWEDWRTGLFFTEQVAKLADVGIPLVIVAGNHDAASLITRRLRLPKGITLLPHDQCGQILLDEYGVAIHGQSFATRAITEDLSWNYPQAVPGLFNIGLLHTSLTGRFGHDNYAPTTVEALVAKGYDYWALGHVHAREVAHEKPWIVFSGNLQGRQIRESGAKGASLVIVRDGHVASVEHRPLDVLRWCPVPVSVAEESNLDGAMTRIGRALSEAIGAAEGRPIAARVTLTGATPLHGQLLGQSERIRQGVIAEGRQQQGDMVWIESVAIDTQSTTDLDTLRGRPDIVGRLAEVLDELIDEIGIDLLDEYPVRLRHRMPGIELPIDHPLREGGPDLLKRARELVLTGFAQQA